MIAGAGARIRPARSAGLLRRLLSAAPAALPHLVAQSDALPLARASLGLVWSNLMLPALDDPLPTFREIHRTLEVDGLLMFSTLGPDTLRELRAALPDRRGERVHRFIDMHDLGDALVRSGLAEPVLDVERFTLTYAEVRDLMRDLKDIGAHNANAGRPRGLTGKGTLARMTAAYEAFRSKVREFHFSPCTICGHCSHVEGNEEDCYGNAFPTCGGCLWAEGLIQCP